jgi:hypothetical protein
MRSAGVPSFALVTVAVFCNTVLRVFNITHLRQTVRVGSLVEITRGKKLVTHLEQLG